MYSEEIVFINVLVTFNEMERLVTFCLLFCIYCVMNVFSCNNFEIILKLFLGWGLSS